jgi:hypothetical protein
VKSLAVLAEGSLTNGLPRAHQVSRSQWQGLALWPELSTVDKGGSVSFQVDEMVIVDFSHIEHPRGPAGTRVMGES